VKLVNHDGYHLTIVSAIFLKALEVKFSMSTKYHVGSLAILISGAKID